MPQIDRNDIIFGVDFRSEFFDALNQHFRIAERDLEVIVGNVSEHSMGPLPLYKNIEFFCEDITIFAGGQQ